MQKVLILANCQGSALGKILENIVNKHGKRLFKVLNFKPVFELTQDQQPLLEDLCRQCDILLYQPHLKHKFTPEWRTSDYWVSITSAKYVISFPSLYFSGYNPELTYLRNKKNEHLNAGFVDYHDKRIVKLFLSGKSDEDIANRFSQLHLSRIDVENNLNDTLNELRRREKEQDIDIVVSEFITKNFTKKRLFFTFNHPANAVLYEVARQLLNKLAYDDISVPKVDVELLRYDYFPIAPSVRKYLGLEFEDDTEQYRIQGKDIQKEKVVARYLDVYRANRDWVMEAATFNERWFNHKKIILHIGQSKTGTTSFQSYCFKFRKELLAEGVLYPKTGLHFTHHRKLARHYKGEFRDDSLVYKLKQEISETDCEKVLISCESFEDLNYNQAKEFLDDFSDMDVFILCTLRSRIDWVQSMYTEYVKKAWFKGRFSQFVGFFNVHPWVDKVLNWKIALSIRENQIVRHVHKLLSDKINLGFWLNLLPKEKLIFVSSEGDNLWEILSFRFGIKRPVLNDEKENWLNTSPSVQAVEFARMYFRRQRIRDIPYAAAVNFLLQLDKKFLLDLSPNSFFSSEEQLAKFLSRYTADDIWLQKNFGFSRSKITQDSVRYLSNVEFLKKNFNSHLENIDTIYQLVVDKNNRGFG